MKSILIAFLYFFSLTSAFGQKKPIVLAAGDWAPFLAKKGLAHNGVGAHVVKKAFQNAGYKVKFKFFPWKKNMTESRKGKVITGGVLWLKKPERVKIFHYSEPVMAEKNVFFHLKKDSFSWAQMADVQKWLESQNYKMGGIKGFSYSPEFDKYVGLQGTSYNLDKATIKPKYYKPVIKGEQNWKKMEKGKVHLYPQEINVGYYKIQTKFPELKDKITHHPKAISESFSHVIIPKTRNGGMELINAFNKGLAQLKASGEYDKMIKASQAGNYECSKYKAANPSDKLGDECE